jgi:hypothetical protein
MPPVRVSRPMARDGGTPGDAAATAEDRGSVGALDGGPDPGARQPDQVLAQADGEGRTGEMAAAAGFS